MMISLNYLITLYINKKLIEIDFKLKINKQISIFSVMNFYQSIESIYKILSVVNIYNFYDNKK